LSKAVATYWNKSSAVDLTKKNRAKPGDGQNSATPNWFVFATIITVTFMVCISINLRAYSELSTEINEHETLNSEIEQLTTENLLLQKEVRGLKTDPRMIEREARKIGMGRPNEKILVPKN